MPTGSTYGRQISPSSFRHLGRIGPSESELARFLYPLAFRDVVLQFDHFTGPALNTHYWAAGNTNGVAFDPPSTQLLGGVCQGVTGAVAGDEGVLYGDAVWAGDNRCGMEICWKINNITSIQFETGFTDPLTTVTTSAIDDIDTPTITNGATDVALVGMDTGQTLTTMALITDGSTANMNTTKTNLGTRTPTNATYIAVRVQLEGNTVFAYLLDADGALTEEAVHGAVTATQIEGGTLLLPWFYIEPLTTSARTVDVDYWGIWQDRAA